jgi:hypothetical protein
MWEHPTTIVFGVRHKKLFAFLDNAGEVLDAVIEMPEAGEIAGVISFEEVAWTKATGSRVRDEKRGVTVDFNVDGLVLTVDPVKSRLTRDAAKRLVLALAGKVLAITGGDDRVDRIGTSETYHFAHQSSGETAVSVLTTLRPLAGGIDTTTPHDFAMRVSFRSATEQALARTGVADWRNTILQVWNRRSEERDPDTGRLDVTIDYQTYFVPAREYHRNLVEDHHGRFLQRLEALQSGKLAGLAGEEVVR